jgi:hypothetical protein
MDINMDINMHNIYIHACARIYTYVDTCIYSSKRMQIVVKL